MESWERRPTLRLSRNSFEVMASLSNQHYNKLCIHYYPLTCHNTILRLCRVYCLLSILSWLWSFQFLIGYMTLPALATFSVKYTKYVNLFFWTSRSLITVVKKGLNAIKMFMFILVLFYLEGELVVVKWLVHLVTRYALFAIQNWGSYDFNFLGTKHHLLVYIVKKYKLCKLADKLRNVSSFCSKWFIKCFFYGEQYSQTLSSVTGRLVEWELGASSRLTGGGRGGLTKHTRRAILATNGRNPLLVPLMPRASSLRRCKLHHPYC